MAVMYNCLELLIYFLCVHEFGVLILSSPDEIYSE